MDKKENLDKILALIRISTDDILVFPELCTTGYFFLSKDELLEHAEHSGGQTVSEIQELASTLNKTIVFGFAEVEGNNFYNSAAIIMPDKSQSRIYRKSHLFFKEKLVFSQGNSGFFVVDDKANDIKIGTMICYDWRFPESARSLTLLGADLIVCPSNLVTKIWTSVMPTRAIENKVYLAVANRFGQEERNGEILSFNGLSSIYDYNGSVLAQAGSSTEEILRSEIHPEKTRDKSFNPYNDILKDRRPDIYI
jgi:predicted amidohydrolase